MTSSAAGYQSFPVDRPGGVNQKQIFFASFMTLVAAGIGFAVRAGILGDWGAQFGFTKSELGEIFGAGLAGFGFTIIFFSFFADTVGYKALLLGAFALHVLSAVITLMARPIYDAYGQHATYWLLYVGTFIFSLANGLCEAAINPLTATLFPRQKTHYLNILHAGWPGGLIIGGLINYLFQGKDAKIVPVRWEILLAIYLLPALYYGLIVLKNRFPLSEAKAAGVNLGQMIAALFAPILIFLFLLHIMVGYVELGTDGWIQNIMKNTIANNAALLFVYTSLLMFVLRFFAGPIVHKINPLGLLCISACFGAIGLYLLGTVTGVAMAFVAGTVFALGKTFYWPTMLGVIGERFPRAGALAMGISGGLGMLSAGFLGSPGIGYTQDYHASHQLMAQSMGSYDRIKAANPDKFLLFPSITGLDGQKVDIVTEKNPPFVGEPAPAMTLKSDLAKKPNDEGLKKLNAWYEDVEQPHIAKDEIVVNDAVVQGGRAALRITAGVPVAMAIGYLLLVLYFVAKGGYKAIHLDASGREIEVDHKTSPVENETGGVPAGLEA